MVDIGRGSFLRVVKVVGAGAYLDGEQLGEILLPNAELPQGISEDDEVEVFISRDSEDRLIATTQFPFAQVGEFALLKVAALEPIGTFLDWGLKKDLFLPPAETTRDLRVGDEVVVYIGLDSKERLVASMKVSDFTESETEDLKAGQKVELLVFGKSDMGFKALIDGRWEGLLFGNEVFQQLRYGDKVEGYVKQIREDGKIDLSLRAGTGAVLIDETAQKIMTALSEGKGFVAVNDKTSAEEVHRLFGVSKKKYKIALGGLYKKRALRVEQDGIYAVTDALPADSKTEKS
jgi:predicted RNA-binding protein (virulence factor B family)